MKPHLPTWVRAGYGVMATIVTGWILLAHALTGGFVAILSILPVAILTGLLWPIALPYVLIRMLVNLLRR